MLSEASFGRLLTWLEAGTGSGADRYLELRRRLCDYFDRKNCRAPDDLADETLNRVARRLEEEGSLDPGPPARYCYIVAKFVFLEYTRQEKQVRSALEANPAPPVVPPSQDGENDLARRLSSLEHCLGRLPSNDRTLILEYYGPGDQRNAERRRALAARLGITTNALAIRACRVRDALERCVRSREAEV